MSQFLITTICKFLKKNVCPSCPKCFTKLLKELKKITTTFGLISVLGKQKRFLHIKIISYHWSFFTTLQISGNHRFSGLFRGYIHRKSFLILEGTVFQYRWNSVHNYSKLFDGDFLKPVLKKEDSLSNFLIFSSKGLTAHCWDLIAVKAQAGEKVVLFQTMNVFLVKNKLPTFFVPVCSTKSNINLYDNRQTYKHLKNENTYLQGSTLSY